jgi:hypothetical protein
LNLFKTSSPQLSLQKSSPARPDSRLRIHVAISGLTFLRSNYTYHATRPPAGHFAHVQVRVSACFKHAGHQQAHEIHHNLCTYFRPLSSFQFAKQNNFGQDRRNEFTDWHTETSILHKNEIFKMLSAQNVRKLQSKRGCYKRPDWLSAP